ncbi:MAG: hypothetical protein ACJ74Y_11065, partial [Bryobacteraceae bacterium]
MRLPTAPVVERLRRSGGAPVPEQQSSTDNKPCPEQKHFVANEPAHEIHPDRHLDQQGEPVQRLDARDSRLEKQ